MFELPSRKDVSKCVITKETIQKGLKPTLVTTPAPATTSSRTSSPQARARRRARTGRAQRRSEVGSAA